MDPLRPNRLSRALAEGSAELGVPLSPAQLDQMLHFLDLLGRWNRAYNLTAIQDPALMVSRHLLDSLAVAPYLEGGSILDLGTGAGLPGLPLAIAETARRFWLLDSNGKKVRFVRQAVLDLALPNVEPVHCRSESYRPSRKFSTIVVRAFSSIAQIHLQTLPLVASPGLVLIMKGRYPVEELKDPVLAGLTLETRPLRVPLLDGERHLIEIHHD